MARLFGTDGIRGKVNEQLTCEIAYKFGQAAVKFQGQDILIARDSRTSGTMLECAIVSGIASLGGTAHLAGIIPTPAVAYLSRTHHYDGGIMISASHNPPVYNGLKMFDGSGLKLPDSVEDEIEDFILSGGAEALGCVVGGDEVGTCKYLSDATEEYISFVVDSVKSQDVDFSGWKIGLDTGHGASSDTSFEILTKLGAEVVSINRDFDGHNINVECGSTHLSPLHELVGLSGCDIGIAHDGDADRVMMITSSGREIDGDTVLALCAKDLSERGRLANNTVVGTVMSNLGLVHALRDEGIDFVATSVGDRYVLEEMQKSGYVLGGEQSGHIIMLDYNTTGDGIMSAVQFLAAVKRTGKSIDEAVSFYKKFPQALINVEVEDKQGAINSQAAQQSVRDAEEQLGESGRVLLRPSGTEPVVRVMVEAESHEICQKLAQDIAESLK